MKANREVTAQTVQSEYPSDLTDALSYSQTISMLRLLLLFVSPSDVAEISLFTARLISLEPVFPAPLSLSCLFLDPFKHFDADAKKPIEINDCCIESSPLTQSHYPKHHRSPINNQWSKR